MGLVGYYRRFIPNFASIALPVTDLTKKRHPQQMERGDAQEAAFKKLQSLLITTPILTVANPVKPYTLQMDASDRGLGAVLRLMKVMNTQLPTPAGSCSLVKLTISQLKKSA